MTAQLDLSFVCEPVREIHLDDSPKAPMVQIVNAIADLEGEPQTELPSFHDSVDPMALSLMLEHSREKFSELCIGFTYAGWNVFARGDGTVVIGDPTEKTTATPLF